MAAPYGSVVSKGVSASSSATLTTIASVGPAFAKVFLGLSLAATGVGREDDAVGSEDLKGYAFTFGIPGSGTAFFSANFFKM